MKLTKSHYRQGDVLIQRVSRIPRAKLKPIKGKRIVLAHGEVTGHAHALVAGRNVKGYSETGTPESEASYLEIAEAVAMLTHEEHSTIELPAGKYRVTHQREYSPQAIRRVAD